MQYVAPVIVLVLMLMMGMQIENYTGQSISQAFANAQQTHNYTIPENEFNQVANDYITPEWDRVYIQSSDVQEAERRANEGFVYNWMRDATGLGEALYDAFNHEWSADVDSKVIYVYDDAGNTIGATYIVGIVRSQIPYRNRVETAPEYVRPARGGQWVCFYSISQEGSYYHTDLDGINNNSNVHVAGFGVSNFAYDADWNDNLETASGIYFTRSNVPNYVNIWSHSNQANGVYCSPVVGRGDIATENETIGEGTLPDGTTVPVYPNGAIVLPDGTIVEPSADGTYPISVNLTLDSDYWAELAKQLADAQAAKDDTLDGTTEKELLDNIRDTNADTLNYLKTGFWQKLKEFFGFNTDGILQDDYVDSPNDIIKRCWERLCDLFGVQYSYE